MLNWLLKKIVGTNNQREVKRLRPLIEQINEFEKGYQGLSEEQLIAKTAEFKDRAAKGETLDALLPEAFALVKNACRRFTDSKRVIQVRGQNVVWEMIPFDVQLMGGVVLHRGKIAEMATGEGKTLVATLPCYLNALSGKGVHVVTVNDYLAKRDAEWMGQIHKFLALSTGVIVHGLDDIERQRNYQCDITYGQNNQFRF